MRRIYIVMAVLFVAFGLAACLQNTVPQPLSQPFTQKASAATLVVTINGAPHFIRAANDTTAGPTVGRSATFSRLGYGDTIICAFSYGDATHVTSISAPSDFTRQDKVLANQGSTGLAVFTHRVMQGESTGHYSFATNGATVSIGTGLSCEEFSGVDPLTPVSAIASGSQPGSSLAFSPVFGAPVVGTEAAAFFADDELQSGTTGAPTGWTEDASFSDSSGMTLEAQHLLFAAPAYTIPIGTSVSWHATSSHQPVGAIVLLNPVGGVVFGPLAPIATPPPTPVPLQTIPPTPSPAPPSTAPTQATPIPSPSISATPSPSPSPSPTASPSPSASPSGSPSASPSGSPSASSSSSPTSAPTVAPSIPMHMLVYEQKNYTFHPSSDYPTIAKYVDYIETGRTRSIDAYNAGIKVVGYTDWAQLHSNQKYPINTVTSSESVNDNNGKQIYLDRSNANGKNGSPQFGNLANVAPSPCPTKSDGTSGSPCPYPYLPINGTNATPQPNATPLDGTIYGDPGSTALQASENTYLNSYNRPEFGNNFWGYTVGRDDDSADYAENTFHMCAGIPTQAQYVAGCAAPVLTGNHYFDTVMSAQWLAAVHSMFQSQVFPIFFNDDTDPRYANYLTSNVLGGQCEVCITHNPYAQGQPFWSETTWQNQLDAGIANEENGKIEHYFNWNANTKADEAYGFASMLLIMNDMTKIMSTEDLNGSIDPTAASSPANGDSLEISPWFYLLVSQPQGPDITIPTARYAPTAWNPQNPPTDVGVAVLKQPSGAYARKYGACYIKKRLFGSCTVIVNPTNNSASISPLLPGNNHTIAVSGNGVGVEFGDTGAITELGSPATSSIPAHTGVVLTP